MLLIIIFLIFSAALLLALSFAGDLFKPKIDVPKRMERYIRSLTATTGAAYLWEAGRPEMAEDEPVNKFRKMVDKYGKKIEAKGYTKRIELELLKGDIPLRGYEFIFIVLGIMLGFVLLIFLWNRNIVSMFVAGLFGLMGPILYLRLKQLKKVTKFNNQLGDALVMISNSLKAGYGFMQAIDLVAKEMAPPIQIEFARVIQEINLGITTEDALIHLSERVPSPDLDLVITAMLIQRQIGGNLSETLDNISQTIRDRIKIKCEVKALTAQGRLSGLIIGMMPVGIVSFLLLINPKYMMQLFTDPRGQFMLGYAVVAELIAVLIIRKIINIKV
jgi:tight adherence protein B